MSYVTKYTVPFKTTSNISCVVEIQEDGFSGTSTELVAGTDPFVVSIEDDDFLYNPTRFSTAKLKIVGDDYLQSLFSTNYQQFRVVFKRDNIVTWIGFISPEIYTQDYSKTPFELEISCMSAMSTLDQIDYSISGSYTFVSLWDILKKCINASKAGYSNIYIPHVYSTDAGAYELVYEFSHTFLLNILQRMTVSEQNFFDEDGKAMKLKEVLEEVCKLMNWTCVDWCGSLYFIDVDYSGQYYKYSSDFSAYEMVSINAKTVQDIEFSGNGHTLDILGGYNKASVKTSTYSVGTIFTEEDYDKLKLFYNSPDYTSGDDVAVKRFYLPSTYKLRHYAVGSNPLLEVEDITPYPDSANDFLGAMTIKRCNYKLSDNISNYSFENMIQVRRRHSYGSSELLNTTPVLEFAGELPVASFSSGAIAISCEIQLIDNPGLIYHGDTNIESLDPLAIIEMTCKLSIGNKYWNGLEWVDTDSSFIMLFYGDDILKGSFVAIHNTKNLSDPYTGLSGYLIPLPNDYPLHGEVKFVMCGTNNPIGDSLDIFYGYFIKNLAFNYKILDTIADSVNGNTDRIYESVVNDDYINELDEIEFKISSWNNDEAAYSKVLLGNDYLKDNLYCILTNSLVRPEEQLIKRIIDQYSSPKNKLRQVLKYNPDILPFTVLSDNFMVNDKFTITGGEIYYKEDSFEVIMIQNGNN